MSQLHCNNESGNGKYLTEKDRYKLEVLLNEKVHKRDIARALKKSLRTINREVKRGSIVLKDSLWRDKYSYCADVSQERYEMRASNKGSPIRLEKDHRLAAHIEKKIKYAHPYSSWERGTNENTNKLIRRFIPKGYDIGKYGDEEIDRIQHWINNYPRRILGYRCANQMKV